MEEGASERVVETLAGLVVEGATGLLEVRSGRKRWQFYLEDGGLTCTRSNLKSEQEEALRRTHGRLSAPDLARVQAALRLTAASRADDSDLTFTEDERAAQPFPTDVRRVLFEAVRDAFDEDALRQLVAPLLEGWPIAEHIEEELGAGGPLDAYLAHLDGSRVGTDVVDFAPVEPRAVMAGLWLAWRIGLVSVESPEEPVEEDVESPVAAPVQVAPVGPAAGLLEPSPPVERAPARSESPAGGLDVAALIAAGLAESAPAAAVETPAQGPRSQVPAAEAPPPAEATRPAAARTPAPLPSPTPADAADQVTMPAKPEAAARPGPTPEERLAAMAARIDLAESHFDVLGVAWDSAPPAFRAAYMALARDLHPDRFAGASAEAQDQATGLFDRVRAAWEVLGDDAARLAYIDRVIHGKKTEEELAMEAVQAYWDAEAEFKRGMAAFNAGRIVDAHEAFQRAVTLAGDELEFRVFAAYTSFYVNRTKEPATAEAAVARLQEALDRNASQERKLDNGWVLRARVYREQGDLAGARRAAMRALKINAANGDAVRMMRRLEEEETAARAQATLFGRLSGWFSGLFRQKDK